MTHVVSENRVLAMVLAVLCVVVAVLAGFVVVGVNQNKNAGEVATSADEVDEGFEPGVMVGSSPEKRAAYKEFKEKFDAVQAEAEKLMGEAKVNEVMDLYNNAREEYEQTGAYSRVQEYILAEYDMLMGAGYKQEALSALVSANYDVFPANIRHRMYLQIIELAQELGRTDIAAEYGVLAEETRAAFESSDAAIQRVSAELDKEMMEEETE